jgi:hypothetical protein
MSFFGLNNSIDKINNLLHNMKIKYNEFGGFEFIAEDGKDTLWLRELVENANKEGGEFLVDMESCNVLDDGSPAKDIKFDTAKDKEGNVWGSIERIQYSPFGF